MSVVITKEDTKKEGIKLLSDLRVFIKDLENSKDFEDLIKKTKEDLRIAENVAMYFQAKRENKQEFNSCTWFDKYQSYVMNKTEDAREKLLEAIPSSVSFSPDFESIEKIFLMLDFEMELNEDLYYDFKRFLCKNFLLIGLK